MSNTKLYPPVPDPPEMPSPPLPSAGESKRTVTVAQAAAVTGLVRAGIINICEAREMLGLAEISVEEMLRREKLAFQSQIIFRTKE